MFIASFWQPYKAKLSIIPRCFLPSLPTVNDQCFLLSAELLLRVTTSLARGMLKCLSPRLARWSGPAREWGSPKTEAMNLLLGLEACLSKCQKRKLHSSLQVKTNSLLTVFNLALSFDDLQTLLLKPN